MSCHHPSGVRPDRGRLCDCNQGRLPCTCKPHAHHLQRTAADERADSLESGIKWESDRNALLLASLTEADDMLSITSLEAGRRIDQLEGLLFSLPEDLKALSGCENTAGVYACIDYIEQCIAGLQQVTAKQPLY